jgi:hypothetical protein
MKTDRNCTLAQVDAESGNYKKNDVDLKLEEDLLISSL